MIFNPFLFHGSRHNKHYFEGWYYKFVNKNLDKKLVIIPGVSLNKADSHAFIQVFYSLGDNTSTFYIRFSLNDFFYDKFNEQIKIKENVFSKTECVLNIESEEISLQGTLYFEQLKDIHRNIWKPGIMGYFQYIPFLQGYHAVISMNHLLKGKVIINNDSISFEDGKGYIEKDRGISFPKEYIWIQSNHFPKNNTAFVCSIAKIPFLGLPLTGFFVVLQVDNKEYRFATYNNAKIKTLKIIKNHVKFSIKRGKYEIRIHAFYESSLKLVSPIQGKMSSTIKESLNGTIEVILKRKNEILFQSVGKPTAMEVMMK
jgi:hypothetical protein